MELSPKEEIHLKPKNEEELIRERLEPERAQRFLYKKI